MIQELLADPETIPFTNRRGICLALLKKDIDRRIVKIRAMVGGYQGQPFQLQHLLQKDKGCQTERVPATAFTSPFEAIPSLPPANSLIFNLFKQTTESKTQKRSSLPVRNKYSSGKQSQQSQEFPFPDKKDYTNISDYLSRGGGYKGHRLDSQQGSSSKEGIEVIQRVMQFDMTGQFGSSKKPFQWNRESLYIPLKGNQMDERGGKTERNSFSPAFMGRRKYSNFGSKPASGKKVKFTDRTAADYEKRVTVSGECREQMMEMVEKMQLKTRREAQDWKIRENIIRKVDEKYAEFTI